MTTGKRLTEFGKREPAPPPATPPSKRSGHVALLVMGTLAVGGGAYAVMPSQNCQPPAPPGMAAPAVPQTGSGCTTRTSSGGSGGGGTRYGYFSGGDSSGRGGAGPSAPSSGGVTRGGFGAFAHAFGFGGG